MRMNRTVGTVERERERVEFRKTSFFCDAKKVENILKAETINTCINKTDYQGVLEGFIKISGTFRKGLKNIPEFHSLMFSDNLFFR